MPEQPLQKLALQARDLEVVRAILLQHLPAAEIWAFGSRVNGMGHEASDLDLVARNPATPSEALPGIAGTRSAFIESDLPIRVDLQDWALIPESFRQEIARGFVVLQRAENSTTQTVRADEHP